MKKIPLLFLLIFSLLLDGCGYRKNQEKDYGGNEHTEEIASVIVIYTTKMKYEKHLNLENSKITYNNKVKKIRVDLITQNILDMCHARELLVDYVEGLLAALNKSHYVNCYISHPFDVCDLVINIDCESYYSRYADPFMIGLIKLKNGIASYYAADEKDCNEDCWHKREEHYRLSYDYVTVSREAEKKYRPEEIKEDSLLKELRWNPFYESGEDNKENIHPDVLLD